MSNYLHLSYTAAKVVVLSLSMSPCFARFCLALYLCTMPVFSIPHLPTTIYMPGPHIPYKPRWLSMCVLLHILSVPHNDTLLGSAWPVCLACLPGL